MKQLLKTFIVLITLGFATASIFAAKDISNDDLDLLGDEDISNIDITKLEEELKLLLAEEDLSDIESLEAQESTNEPVSEEETLVIDATPKSDEAQEFAIKYDEPLTKPLAKELEAQPDKQEVIILDEIGENNKDIS